MSESGTSASKRPRTRTRFGVTVARTLRIAWEAEPRTLGVMLALTLLPAAIPPLIVAFSQRLVDLIASADRVPSAREDLLLLVGGIGGLMIVRGVASVIGTTRQNLFAERVRMETTRRFLRHAATVDLGHFDDSDWHDRVARANRDVAWRSGQMTCTLITLTGSAIGLIGMLGILASLHPFLLVLVTASVLPTVVVNRYLSRRLYSFSWDETPDTRERDYLSDLLTGTRTAKEIRSFELAEPLVARQRELWNEYYLRMRGLLRHNSGFNIGTSVLSSLAFASAYWFVAEQGLAGRLTPGALTAVIAAFTAVTQQFTQLTQGLVMLDQHSMFLEDYFSFLDTAPLLPVPEPPQRLPDELEDGVRFEGVSFRYRGAAADAVSGIDLHIRSGELLALVGENGAGKSSLIKLLLRFYDPTQGRVTVGGVDLRDTDPREVRARSGVLFQDFASYELAARDNVAFGRIEANHADPDLWRALRAGRADAIVERLRQGLDSKVGRLFEGGQDLSGGEWQRLALARLMYRDADIWILDEPTSALDPEAEAAIFAELRGQLKGRIGIVVSHRFSTVRMADRIAVLENGGIIELGSHEELLALQGRYAQLFELQAAAYR